MTLTPFQRMLQHTTPIWNAEKGYRLRLARMRLLLDQAQIAKDLGVNQQTVSRIESGRILASRAPVTTERWQSVLGGAFNYVMFGTGDIAIEAGYITRRFWDTKLKRSGVRLRGWKQEKKDKQKNDNGGQV